MLAWAPDLTGGHKASTDSRERQGGGGQAKAEVTSRVQALPMGRKNQRWVSGQDTCLGGSCTICGQEGSGFEIWAEAMDLRHA